MTFDGSIIIYTVGKVGSCTILNSLRAVAGNRMIYQIHTLNKEAISGKYYEGLNKPVPGHVMHSRLVANQLEKGLDGRKCKIVSLIREPISRNISAFFENIETFAADFYEKDYTDKRKIGQSYKDFFKGISV